MNETVQIKKMFIITLTNVEKRRGFSSAKTEGIKTLKNWKKPKYKLIQASFFWIKIFIGDEAKTRYPKIFRFQSIPCLLFDNKWSGTTNFLPLRIPIDKNYIYGSQCQQSYYRISNTHYPKNVIHWDLVCIFLTCTMSNYFQ